MRQPFLLGTFVYIALVAGRISNGKDLKTAKDDVTFINGPQSVKGHEIATANPIVRAKRVTSDPEDITFWANRGRRRGASSNQQYQSVPDIADNLVDYIDVSMDWTKDKQDEDFGELKNKRPKEDATTSRENVENADKNCPAGCTNRSRREEINEPFWGNRGRRNEETNIFWGNRGRRSDEDSPFWGNRGKKSEIGPFWGNRGKKESDYRDKKNPIDNPFWGNRGKRNEGPFWGNRGRRSNENEFNPFWGNRGKKDEIEPFWGNRGRRNDPFWAVRGKKEKPFWGNRGKKDYIEPALFDNQDLYTNFHFLELIDKSKCFSNFLNRLNGNRGDIFEESNPIVHLQEPRHFPDNVLIYSDENSHSEPVKVVV